MITEYIDIILLITGIATASLLIQAVAPRYALSAFYGKSINDEFALFLARAGGLPIAMLGLLLIWATFDDQIRDPVIVAALVGKSVFLGFILMNWRVTGRGYAMTIAVDSTAVFLFTLYLLGY